MTRYLSCAETAKLIRQALKEAFPRVKFSVRSHTYSGGASIDVRWTDGPNPKQVEAITSAFNASYFDAMIDYKGARYHKLDGEDVRFGADYIFTERKYSDALIERAIKFLRAKYPGNDFSAATVEAYRSGNLWNVFPTGGEWSSNNSLAAMIGQTLAKLSDRAAPESCPTLNRVAFVGDDGYGAGTVGRDGDGGEQCYKAISAAQERQREQEQAAEEAARDIASLIVLASAEPVGGVQ